ncbi:MAG TPA: gliding motility protein GldN, partial [Porphyromonadaceae bacterium]|nr:gliding motility protein GldN [Porphyromonadaceae bacterium]
IKERYYFDQRSSQFEVMVEAICPVLHRGDEWGEEELKYPLFWVKMADLMPYLSNSFIMLSDLNNANHTTLNDYFALHLYKGEIYKTSNLLNRNLTQYCPDETSLSEEQNRIENELKTFEENLWASDSTRQYSSIDGKKKKNKKCTSPTTSKFSSSKSKNNGGGDASSSSGAVYSVRRDR